MSIGFCTLCNLQIDSFDNLTECPRCGTKGVPCHNDNQISISINLHELRILCIWSENWANTTEAPQDVIYAIAARLRKQLPENKKNVPLTMADEFAALKDAGYDYETNHPSGDQP